jgi:transcriptional regulator with XRE-family HTH domain
MIIRNPQQLANQLHKARVTQRELARIAGWASTSYAWRILNGQARTITAHAAQRIAERLGVDVDDIVTPGQTTKKGHVDK